MALTIDPSFFSSLNSSINKTVCEINQHEMFLQMAEAFKGRNILFIILAIFTNYLTIYLLGYLPGYVLRQKKVKALTILLEICSGAILAWGVVLLYNLLT